MKWEPKCDVKREFGIIYLLLICFCLILSTIRWINSFNRDIVFINNEVTSHISNLSLSMMLYLYWGQMMLLYDVKFKYIILVGISLILGNFVYELFLSILNTKDIIDAIYGLIGCILSFSYLALTKKFGLILNK